jgi:hypothetical protein
MIDRLTSTVRTSGARLASSEAQAVRESSESAAAESGLVNMGPD